MVDIMKKEQNTINKCSHIDNKKCGILKQYCDGEYWQLCQFNFFKLTKPDNCSNSVE